VHIYLIHYSLGLLHSPAAQSVLLFLHDQCHIFPQKFALTLGGHGPRSNTCFHGPTQPTTPNVVSIELAVFPHYPLVTSGHPDRKIMELDQYQQVAYTI